MVSVGPNEDQLLRERAESLPVAYPTILGEKFWQRRSARQTSQPHAKGTIDALPIIMRLSNESGLGGWPLAGALKMSVRPFEDLRFGQRREGLAVTSAPVFRQ